MTGTSAYSLVHLAPSVEFIKADNDGSVGIKSTQENLSRLYDAYSERHPIPDYVQMQNVKAKNDDPKNSKYSDNGKSHNGQKKGFLASLFSSKPTITQPTEKERLSDKEDADSINMCVDNEVIAPLLDTDCFKWNLIPPEAHHMLKSPKTS